MLDFTAIDFETANYHRTSACSIGLAKVRDGKIVQTEHFLIYPHPDFFVPRFIDIHGIAYADVRNAPTFAELWPELLPFFENETIAAHNAQFDMGVLLACLEYYGLERPDLDVLCSLRLSRAAYPGLPSHALNNVCQYLDLPLNHHRADSDAEGCAGIILDVAKKHDLSSLEDVQQKLYVRPGRIRNGKYSSSASW